MKVINSMAKNLHNGKIIFLDEKKYLISFNIIKTAKLLQAVLRHNSTSEEGRFSELWLTYRME